MQEIRAGAIEQAAEKFLGLSDDPRPPSRRRERSWDLCYAHFRHLPKPTENLELSSLHLGYYLASWGMMRGSSFLFRSTNALHYEPAIEVVEKYNGQLRDWDVPDYLDADRYAAYSAAWQELRAVLLPDGGRSLTLISKVMMGVWGCVPSFDSYFVSTFRALSDKGEKRAWGRAGPEALRMLREVDLAQTAEIDRVRATFPVWSWTEAQGSPLLMPRAKVLDIFGFSSARVP